MNNSGPAAPVQPEIKRGEIAILLSTRGRPDMLLEVFESLRATTVGKDRIALWLYVDDDDQVTRAAINSGKFPELGFPVHWHIGPRTPDWGQTYQVLWTALGRTSAVSWTIRLRRSKIVLTLVRCSIKKKERCEFGLAS